MNLLPLDQRSQTAVYQLLSQDLESNIFLIERLFAHGIQRWGHEKWFGIFKDKQLIAISLVMGRPSVGKAARLIIAFGSLQGCRLLGEHAATLGGTMMLVGPRAAADALWEGLGSPALRIAHPQLLYCCREVTNGPTLKLRFAEEKDLEQLILYSAEMMEEDLGENPLDIEPEHHINIVKMRVNGQKTLVAEQLRSGVPELAFVLDVGSSLPLGAQVGGTFVPKHLRGQGLSTAGMRAACSLLLEKCECITLHVHKENIPALRCYERVGFTKLHPYRLSAIQR